MKAITTIPGSIPVAPDWVPTREPVAEPERPQTLQQPVVTPRSDGAFVHPIPTHART